MSQSLFALIDINNCYVSCERLFNPKLHQQPVVVLSNNDGCVVSRSNEAKALGITMAVPWYQVEQQAYAAGVHVFSSNYALYADMSRRFFAVLAQYFSSDDLMPYSIDECFIRLDGYGDIERITSLCQQLLQTVQQWLGLPCCIGIGRSKTQAKLANHFAKKQPAFQQLCCLPMLDPCVLEQLYLDTPVSEVWGIGKKTAKKLAAYAIHSVFDLTFANPAQQLQAFSVLIGRTIYELNGQSCIELNDPALPAKSILSSRSFSHALQQLDIIQQAVLFHVGRAHQRLRKQQQLCNCIHVALYEKTAQPPYKTAQHHVLALDYATDDLLEIVHAATKQINVLFKKNKTYVKVSVMFSALESKQSHIHDLWQPIAQIEQREQLMQTLTQMQKRYGTDCIQVGYQSCNQAWKMKQQHRSPRYTTCWQELCCIEDQISPAQVAVTQKQ